MEADEEHALEISLQSMTYLDRDQTLPVLLDSIEQAGGWLMQQRLVSTNTVELRVEMQSRVLLDIYAALVASGIELTRRAHLLLAERCTCWQHRRMWSTQAEFVALRLHLAFLGEAEISQGWLQRPSAPTATA